MMEKKVWRLIIDEPLPASTNMAVDEALFRLCSNGKAKYFPTIRFYQWQSPTLSFGSSQKIEHAVDAEYCRKKGYAIIRRPTGGRAVLHDDEVTYSVVAQTRDELGESIQETYRLISEGILEAFRLINIEAETEGKDQSAKRDKLTYLPCFASSTRYEIAFNGKKIVGSAQRRNNRAFLQHGSILMGFDSKELTKAIGTGETDVDPSEYMISLSQILQRKVTFREIVDYLIKGFEASFNIILKEIPLSNEERKVSDFFEEAKYKTDEWNKTR
jgi:lipoate-protein ligase A